jgi:8-oxo-dGTP diphosphatase
METIIRVGVSAAIVREGQLLLIEFDTTGRDASGVHYNFPGGGVEPGESLREALVREAREEACAEVIVGPLLHVFEYVPAHCNAKYGLVPKLSLLFRCELAEGCEPMIPDMPDAHQIGVRWVSLDDLAGLPAHKTLLPTPSAHLLDLLRGPSQETVGCELIG